MSRRSHVWHGPIADALREIPGLELAVGTYASRYCAKNIARAISTANRMPAYAPAGSFAARWEDAEDGTTVYARYVGSPS